MGFGRLLSRRTKDNSGGYSSRDSVGSSIFSVPESVPPAYPVDGRLNKDAVAIDAKPYMPDFPIMGNNINSNNNNGGTGGEAPRSRLLKAGNVIPRKPVDVPPEQQQQQQLAAPYQMGQAPIPRPPPPFSPGSDSSGSFYHHDDAGLSPFRAPQQPNIHPVNIPVPGIAASRGANPAAKQRHTSGFFSSLTQGSSSSSSSGANNGKANGKGSGSGSAANGNNPSRPHVDVPTSEVRRCTKLLRRMFELQLDMWSMRYAYEQDMPDRLEKRRQADALLVEIQNMIQTWTTTSGAAWSAEERRQVEYIGMHLDSLSQNKFW